MPTFGARLKEACIHAGIPAKPTDLANHLDVSVSLASKWLNDGTKEMLATNVFMLADKLKVSSRWLWLGKGSMQARNAETPEENELLEIWRALSKPAQEFLMQSARNTANTDRGSPSKFQPYRALQK